MKNKKMKSKKMKKQENERLLIGSLVIGMIRWCNQNCPHCLRGPAENLCITKEIIRKAIRSYKYISCLTITGGEPTLRDDLIKYIIDLIIDLEIPLGSVYIVTNGLIYSQRLVNTMRKAYEYAEDKDMCALCVSVDEYHLPNSPAYHRYSEECPEFFSDGHVFAPGSRREAYRQLINEGNAYYNGIGQRNLRYFEYFDASDVYVTDDTIEYSDGLVYVSSNGNVVFDCDMSYEHIDEFAAGNILLEPLADIFMRRIRNEEAV